MPHRERKEIGVDLLGVNGLNSFTRNVPSARQAMFATHIGQAPVIKANEPRKIMTGMELEYSKYTFDVHFPCDATVLKVVRKYPTGMGSDAIRHNPVTTIIYEDYYDIHKTIGVLHVPEYASFHQDFGFRYKKRMDVWDRLTPGATFSKGEQLARSPAVRDNGLYGLGVEAEVAFMSMPATIEDGFIMSESFLDKMTPTAYDKLIGRWGRKAFPLNLYGDDKVYKPFPDIGERIRDDGMVFALRDHDDNLSIAEMTPRALREVDSVFDHPVYGKAGAVVLDINVFHDDQLNPLHTPVGMDTQARKYYDAQAVYYKTIIDEYYRLKARRGDSLKITQEFDQLIVEALKFLPTPPDKRKLNRVYRLEPLDEWRVEVIYEHTMVPAEGFKFTDFFGGKGVTCKVAPDADMPVDENGNRAEVVIYGGSTIKRMNIGRFYEHFINAASRDLIHRLRKEMGFEAKFSPTDHQLKELSKNIDQINYCWSELMDYYRIVAPIQHTLLENDPDPSRHVVEVLRNGIYLYIPPDNPSNNLEMANELRNSRFCPHYGPVTYRANNGEMVTTERSVLVGKLYMMLLEKTGDDWSGVASVKTNHFGVASKLNNYDKQTSPGRQQSVRGLGEGETRSYVCNVGPEATMEILDQSNNPETHRNVVESILRAPQPTNIQRVVDRKKVPYGGSRPVGFVEHLFACRGLRFVEVTSDLEEDVN